MRNILLTTAAAVFLASPALALETPQASKDDARIRVVTYDPNNVVELYAAPGATLRIQLGQGEEVERVLVSDESAITNERMPPSTGMLTSTFQTSQVQQGQPVQPGAPSCDHNLCRDVADNFVYLRPLRPLAPQPLFLQTKWCGAGKCQDYAYTFELKTRPGDLTEGTPNTYFGVRFVYPKRDAALAGARWAAAQARKKAEEPPPQIHPTSCLDDPAANWQYIYRGDPSVEPDQACDDGRTTVLTYSGNRPVPVVHIGSPNSPATIAYTTDPTPVGNTVRIGRTAARFCLSIGKAVGCLFNVGPDPEGATATTIRVGPK